MAESVEENEEPKPKSKLLLSIILSSVIGFVIGAGAGYAIFAMLAGESAAAADVEPEISSFVKFGKMVVNIGEARPSRYLRIDLTLQVAESDSEQVTQDVERQSAILRNWLIGYLSNLTLEEVTGVIEQNQIRRNIQNYCNDLLAPDGEDLIQDVLFEDFTVQ